MATEVHVGLAVKRRAELAQSGVTPVAPETVLVPVLIAGLQEKLIPLYWLITTRAREGAHFLVEHRRRHRVVAECRRLSCGFAYSGLDLVAASFVTASRYLHS